MKKVFLDTNILLDLVQRRDGFYHAVSVLQGAYEKQYDVCACVLSYANNAIAQPVADFEDMLQYQCAKAAGCDVIVTNNGRDFAEFCNLPFMSAAEFLEQISR